MESPIKISFQGSQPSEALTQFITEEVEALEKYHGRVTACHVIVRVPPHNGRYAVNIHLTLPGNVDVNVDHVSDDDERFIDPQFVVNDAFRRAERQIKDRTRKKRGETKRLHERVERVLDQPEPPTKN